MSEGSTKLQYALKSLRLKWDETKETWTDQVRQDFERKHLAPLDTQVSSTIRAMDHIAEIIGKMRRDCS